MIDFEVEEIEKTDTIKVTLQKDGMGDVGILLNGRHIAFFSCATGILTKAYVEKAHQHRFPGVQFNGEYVKVEEV